MATTLARSFCALRAEELTPVFDLEKLPSGPVTWDEKVLRGRLAM
ncbi:hypothetical protein [Tumebacillus sp. BK434]|nr:hypothetical protein [Tumebacillus sp. BK434]